MGRSAWHVTPDTADGPNYGFFSDVTIAANQSCEFCLSGQKAVFDGITLLNRILLNEHGTILMHSSYDSDLKNPCTFVLSILSRVCFCHTLRSLRLSERKADTDKTDDADKSAFHPRLSVADKKRRCIMPL